MYYYLIYMRASIGERVGRTKDHDEQWLVVSRALMATMR
jgi:hypothetical protein